ncbi:MAG: hypothetical protein V3T05_01055 [Myxococcota bacterium]
MNHRTIGLMLAGTLLVPLGCGYTDAGGGTQTLEVIAKLEYDFRDDETKIEVEVSKNGEALEGARVRIEPDGGIGVDIPQQNAGANAVYILRDWQGYHRRIELLVESGKDRVVAKLEGPGPHTIVNPESTSLSRSSLGDNLDVEWKVDDGVRADEVTISLDKGDYHSTIKDDPGHYEIPSTALESGEERVEVTRRNRIDLAGGIGRSTLEISYEKEVDIVVNE